MLIEGGSTFKDLKDLDQKSSPANNASANNKKSIHSAGGGGATVAAASTQPNHGRSLRNTPGRLRARCERGRAASDSSGISDDSSSNSSVGSGSDRDSGIDVAESAPLISHAPSENIRKNLENMNLNPVLRSPVKQPCTPPKRDPSSPSVKLTLRMKRSSPVLDQVLEKGNALGSEESSMQPKEYEVLRMEGITEDPVDDPDISFKYDKKKRKKINSPLGHGDASAASSSCKLKRLKLILGNDVSTINYEMTSN